MSTKYMKRIKSLIKKYTDNMPVEGVLRYDYDKRKETVEQMAWACPSVKALQEIKDFMGAGRLVEMGAGTGYWSHLLQLMGVAATPYELYKGVENPYGHDNYFTTVWKGGIEHIYKWEGEGNGLFLCWPPYNQEMEEHAIMTAVEANVEKLVYIGEWEYGCTGTDQGKFLRSEHYDLVKEVNIPSWPNIYDNLSLWTLKR